MSKIKTYAATSPGAALESGQARYRIVLKNDF
jgi:hypothetical protein